MRMFRGCVQSRDKGAPHDGASSFVRMTPGNYILTRVEFAVGEMKSSKRKRPAAAQQAAEGGGEEDEEAAEALNAQLEDEEDTEVQRRLSERRTEENERLG